MNTIIYLLIIIFLILAIVYQVKAIKGIGQYNEIHEKAILKALKDSQYTIIREAYLTLNDEISTRHVAKAIADNLRADIIEDYDSQVIKKWIVRVIPGECPIVKSPEQTDEGIYNKLKELRSLYPASILLVCELAYGNQLWVSSEKEFISKYEVENDININKG